MDKPVLVVMAAGMGSRYGSLKQIDPVGPDGQIIIDYSLYDAAKAGFSEVIFIIKKEIEADFKAVITPRIPAGLKAEYVFQSLDDLPQGYSVPQDRVKPWGTAHAVCAARDLLQDSPFVVINADDYYGANAFKVIFDYMSSAKPSDKEPFAMVAYQLGNTLTENGYVSRGVCETDRDGVLLSVTERTKIRPEGPDTARYEDENGQWQTLPKSTPVSMNLWGFTPAFVKQAWSGFSGFLDRAAQTDPLKGEYYLPRVVTEMINSGAAQVQVLHSADKWYGVTYKEDKEQVMKALADMHSRGKYTKKMWE